MDQTINICWFAEFDNSPRDPNNFVQVEWMQFIRNVNKIILIQRGIDVDIDLSDVGGFGSPKQLGKGLHDRVRKEHWSGFEIYPDWMVYLDDKRKKAFIECHNPDLEEIAIQAEEMVLMNNP